ncbi:adenylyl-sulfate kinase [Enterobacterales bacterium endosymbiont of Anomoneura mori]|uniref:adenylyl-sulfate kinase n=1 Tax=Enterobacterales bacterium endosymbiont of Anomoneura mori TaxID=3132096 RepID=UPI00399CF993
MNKLNTFKNKKNIIWNKSKINQKKREIKNKHKSAVLLFTGLSGSGKSTISNELENFLFKKNINTYILDGDNIRFGLCNDLEFTNNDRNENMRRIGEVSKILADAGLIVLISIIAPFRKGRENIRKILKNQNFLEIFVDTPLEICKIRDPKNLYKKMEKNKIKNFTGYDSIYEKPLNPDIYLNGQNSIKSLILIIFKILCNKKIINF